MLDPRVKRLLQGYSIWVARGKRTWKEAAEASFSDLTPEDWEKLARQASEEYDARLARQSAKTSRPPADRRKTVDPAKIPLTRKGRIIRKGTPFS